MEAIDKKFYHRKGDFITPGKLSMGKVQVAPTIYDPNLVIL